MAYPTGSGSEILYRGTIHAQSNTASSFRFADGSIGAAGTSSYAVPALHIITVLSIVITERGNYNSQKVHLYVNDGANDIYLLDNQDISARGTFVWNDKIVLLAGDKLLVNLASGGDMDIHISYIDQDWTTP